MIPKSGLRFSFADNPTTIGAKIVKKEVQLRSGGAKPDIDVTLMIWDVAGQKTLGNVKQAYYRC